MMPDQAPAPVRSLYAYPWDVAGSGARGFIDQSLALGMNAVTIAASYHAGKFLRPHARSGGRVVFPEDGVTYFKPSPHYGELRAAPHSDPALLRVIDELLADGRLRVNAWTVLLHNSRLGALHPDCTARNAYGDGYVYSLCPMQPRVFEYALALACDAAAQCVHNVILETPGWLPYAHGYHHEFSQLRSNVWLDAMLGLCFCDACMARAKGCGIDAHGLRDYVIGRVDGYLGGARDASAHEAQDWLAADAALSAFAAYTAMRQQRVTELVAAIRAAMPAAVGLGVIPTVQRPTSACWLEGSELEALAGVADFIEVPFYEATATGVHADAQATLASVKHPGKVRAILRPGPPDLADGAELAPALEAVRALGIRDVSFYNYGLLRSARLDALGAALARFDWSST